SLLEEQWGHCWPDCVQAAVCLVVFFLTDLVFTGVGFLTAFLVATFFSAAGFLGSGGAKPCPASVRESISFSRGIPAWVVRTRRRAKLVSFSSSNPSTTDVSTSSAVFWLFSSVT